LAKTPRSTSKTQYITDGLPRVAELFEARRPKEAAEMAKIDGVISFGGMIRNKKRVWVTETETGCREEHLIPHGIHLVVHEGDFVNRGQKCDGRVRLIPTRFGIYWEPLRCRSI
jgi:DNA-directed RNA polymerase subunit beta'